MSEEHNYTHEDVERFVKHGDVANGIPFDWWLASSDGAGFCLCPTKGLHTPEQVKAAEVALHRNRDVVGRIKVAWLEPKAEAKPADPSYKDSDLFVLATSAHKTLVNDRQVESVEIEDGGILALSLSDGTVARFTPEGMLAATSENRSNTVKAVDAAGKKVTLEFWELRPLCPGDLG